MKKYLIYSLLALFCTTVSLTSCGDDDDDDDSSSSTSSSSSSNSTETKTIKVALYSTTTGEIVGYSTTTATRVNGKNTLSCVEKDLDGNVLDEYTVENATDLAINLIGTWKTTSYSYTDDNDASENESTVYDSQNYAEALFTAKVVIERFYEGGKLVETVSNTYSLSGSTISINGMTGTISIDGDEMTVTNKDSDPEEGWSGTFVTKYARQ